jgi:hypothetical protein
MRTLCCTCAQEKKESVGDIEESGGRKRQKAAHKLLGNNIHTRAHTHTHARTCTRTRTRTHATPWERDWRRGGGDISYCLLCCSGLMYSGVPPGRSFGILNTELRVTRVRPKSHSLATQGADVSITLWGLRSRWATSFPWRYISPAPTSLAMPRFCRCVSLGLSGLPRSTVYKGGQGR